MLKTDEKTVVFIDGANLYATARGLDFDIDYKKLLSLFQERSNLIRAYYYTVLIEDQEYSPIRPLVDWLDYNGFTLVTKPAKDFTDFERASANPELHQRRSRRRYDRNRRTR